MYKPKRHGLCHISDILAPNPPGIAVETRRDRHIPRLKYSNTMADEEVDWGMAGDDDDVVDFEGMDVDVPRECYVFQS